MLLTGVALSALLDSLIRISLASGNEQVKALLAWLSGSTYWVAWSDLVSIVGYWHDCISGWAFRVPSMVQSCRH